ncbi:DENN domain-containing protein 1A [Nymphon striatum]|nr:DENN domain-containing protein 1A [Nymphon striatum]
MLYERRILITSNKMNRLSACVQAANALIYPMLCAPMPFLIGVPSQILSCELGEVVILDADENKVESPFNDLQSMPSDITSSLKKKLKNPNNMLGEGVAHAFLRALVHLIGGYRDALKLKSGEQITFSDEAFIQSRPQSIQPFLEKMLQLQIFRQFIDERLEKLNSGNGFSDEFEYEVNRYSDRNSIKLKTQYREWTTNMKKEGGAFLKTVKNRTNPAVKHAYKSVKDKSKQAYKGFRTKINDMQVKPQGAIYYQNTDNLNEWQPRSAPASPTSPRSRPRTIHGQKVFKEDAFSTHKNNNNHSNNHYSMYVDQESYIKNGTESESDDRLEDEDVGANTDDTGEYDDTTPEYEALNMDLMGDLQDIIFRKCSISDSSPLEEQRPVRIPFEDTMIGSSSLQSLPEFSSNFGKCQQKSSENTISLIKLDSLVEDEDDFDPLKAGGVSPAFPNNDSFTLDIFKELQNTPSSQNTNFSNPFHSATQSGLSSLHTTKTNPFSSNFNSNAISSTSEQPNVQAKDTKKTSDAPLRQPLSVNDKSQSKPADPFADLVKWDKLSQNTSTNVKANWTSFK